MNTGEDVLQNKSTASENAENASIGEHEKASLSTDSRSNSVVPHDSDVGTSPDIVAKETQKLTADEHQTLRGYRLTRLTKLVKKCRRKKITFSAKFQNLQLKLAKSPHTLSDSEIAVFNSECFEALGSSVDNSHSSSEYSSDETYPSHHRQYSHRHSPMRRKRRNPYSTGYMYNPHYHPSESQTIGRIGPSTLYHHNEMGMNQHDFQGYPCPPRGHMYHNSNYNNGRGDFYGTTRYRFGDEMQSFQSPYIHREESSSEATKYSSQLRPPSSSGPEYGNVSNSFNSDFLKTNSPLDSVSHNPTKQSDDKPSIPRPASVPQVSQPVTSTPQSQQKSEIPIPLRSAAIQNKDQIQAEWLGLINSVPLGERTLPAAYIATLDKPDHLDWPTFTKNCREKFYEQQQEALKQRDQRKRERHDNIDPALLQADTKRLINFENENKLIQETEKKTREEISTVQLHHIQGKSEEQQQQKVEQIAAEDATPVVNSIPLIDSNQMSVQSKTSLTAPSSQTKIKNNQSVTINNSSPSAAMKESISELGSLLSDADVLYALRSLKKIGSVMRANTLKPSNNTSKSVASRTLFSPIGRAVIKAEPSENYVAGIAPLDHHEDNIHPVIASRYTVQSPLSNVVFRGFKRHSQETFAQGQSGKKKRTPRSQNCAPSPSLVSQRSTLSLDAHLALSEEKCKLSDTGDLFLKKKKTAPSTSSALFKAIRDRGKEVVVFETDSQSFYRIMAYYAPHLSVVPENERHVTLKEDLFDFVMENRKYTQVNLKKEILYHISLSACTASINF